MTNIEPPRQAAILDIEQTLAQAVEHHRADRQEEAVALYQSILQADPRHAEANHNMGVMAVQVNQPAAGLLYFRAALDANPSRGQYWLSYIDALFQADQVETARKVLALARQQGLHGEEVDALAMHMEGGTLDAEKPNAADQRASGESPPVPPAALTSSQEKHEAKPAKPDRSAGKSAPHKGKIPGQKEIDSLVDLFGRGLFAEAATLAQAMTVSYPQHEFGWKALGAAYKQMGRAADALVPMQRAAALSPRDAEAHFNLGVTLKDMGRLDEAEAVLRRALQISPDYADAHGCLGIILHDLDRPVEAEASYRRALEITPDIAGLHCNLGDVLHTQGRLEEAEASYRLALDIEPELAEAHFDLGNPLKSLGRLDEAKASYAKARQLGFCGASIKEALMLPAIMGTRQEMIGSREEFERNLDQLIAGKTTIDDPLKRVGETNFFLAYHGLNDRDLQVKVAKYYEQACPSLLYIAPHCIKPKPDAAKKICVGFLSRFLYKHSVSLCYSKIIEALSLKGQFQVSLISNQPIDEKFYTEFVGQRMQLPYNLVRAREMIAALELDILVYLDIGMEPLSYFLAFSRLARAQCVLGGHPVTTGIANMDYFLSADRMEPLDADEHYSEKLIRLSRPLVHFGRPELPAQLKTRHELNLPTGRHIYMCPMRMQKLHPDFDEAIARILQLDDNGVVVLFEDELRSWWKKALLKRFESTIPLELRQRIVFLPWLKDPADFISAIAAADVVLDPFHFGIGSTVAMTSITGTPLVTKAGEFLRGRVGAYFCEMFDLAECIAENTEGYARKAVEIASDRHLRERIRVKILKSNPVLYGDLKPVEELADFFYSLTDSRLNPSK